MRFRNVMAWTLALVAAGIAAARPASALGHKGDPRKIGALRDAGSDTTQQQPSTPTPEIATGALVGALAVVVGGALLLRDRRRR